jgi:transglutaminase-like putative cysteine protease
LHGLVVVRLNSVAGEDLEYDTKPGRHVVAVGGNRLSRGLTLEGLTVSYFLRTASMCDALLQMARWYGFRLGYEDLIRIWTTDGIASWFSELALVEQSLRDSIIALARAGRRPDQMAIRLRAHSKLLLTARNKATTAAANVDSWSGEHPQTVLLPLSDASRLQRNFGAAEQLVRDVGGVREVVGGLLARDVQPEIVIDFLRAYQGHDDAVAFRAEFQGKPPPQQQRYWRGPVFWHYDGRTWRPGNEAQALAMENLEQVAERVNYSVTLEPHNRRWLFMLDLPATTPANAMLTHDYQLLARQPVRSRLRYAASSYLDYRLQAVLTDAMRARALQLPQDSNPQTRALGTRWRTETPEATEIARRALDMFRREPFVYTLTPPLLGEDSVDQFLFTTRRGFCEHYAGSFVFLMRAAGVPARVVTGYQGGEFNPAGNYVLVTQADAHAWAEIWLEDRGWVRIDPTAAVSPQRIELSMAAALPAGEPVPIMMRGDYAWLRKLYLNWDALNNHWNQWVLGYNQQRQMELLARLTGSILSWQDMAAALMATAGTLMLTVAAFLLRGRALRDPLRREWARFQRKLERHGVAPATGEGPLDYARRASGALPAHGAAIRSIAVEYARLRYGAPPEASGLARLTRDIRNFRI